MTNERLCALAQQGDISARDQLVEQNLGFIRDTAAKMYKSLALAESDLAIGKDDLWPELPWWYERRKDYLLTAIMEALFALCNVLDEK